MSKQQMSGEERRTAIIAAAIKVIARTSFEGCSTIEIAKEAGITESPLYYHFKTKKDLQLAVLDTISHGILSILDILHNLPSLTLVEMRAFNKQFQQRLSKNPDRVTIVIKAVAMEDTDIREKLWEIYQTFHKTMKMLLDKIASEKNVSIEEQTNGEAWSLLFWASMSTVITQLGKPDVIPEEQIDWMISLMDQRFQAIIENPKLLSWNMGNELKSNIHDSGIHDYYRRTRQNKIISRENQTSKQRLSGDARRASIIDAAITVIARTSFERSTTAIIAREAGVTEPVIYRHFNSKRDLQLAVLDSILQNSSTLDEPVRDLPPITFPQLRDYLNQFRLILTENPEQISVLLKGFALEDEDAREKLWEIVQSIHGVLKTVLHKVFVHKGTGSEEMINVISWYLLSLVAMKSFINLLGKLDAIPEDQIERHLSFIEDMLEAGTGQASEIE